MKFPLLLIAILVATVLQAQEKQEKIEIPAAEVFISSHSVTIAGKTIELHAESGTHLLRDENDNPIALFGFTSYTKKQDKAASSARPVVFAFNGGPLSASFWLHMGILGPKRIVINDPAYTRAAPYAIVNNEYSILDMADLVMIDPVGVGLSKPVGKAKFGDFWGVDQDIRSIGLFIEQFLIRAEKMNSPKYLLGESYGTFRNAGLMKFLQDKGIAMNGVIMVSAVFDFHNLVFGPGNDISYLTFFPTYATTAWYHNRIPNRNPDLESFVAEIRKFTVNEYAPALLKGDQLTDAEKNDMAGKLASRSGLSTEFWLRADLRVTDDEFFQELLRGEGNTVGRLDSRYKGINQDLLSQFATEDPQSKAISAPYIAAFKDYLYNGLNVRKDLTYMTSTGLREGFKWDWNHTGNVSWNAQTAISTAADMATAMSRDPNLKVLILNGYFDIATVFYGVEHTINHMGLRPEIKKNIIMKYYEAGHMMYTHEPSMIKFKKDVDEFIRSTSN